MDVRPVLQAGAQVLAAVEARDADLSAAVAQLAAWDREPLRVPRVVVGIDGPPDPGRIAEDLAGHGIAGERLALAFPEAWLDAPGMREALLDLRARTGATIVVADFGSGSHPEVDFLVDYPADALALSPRIAAGIGDDPAAAARVRETCSVAGELGWRVIAADVGSPEEREALAEAGVAEVTGPAVAPFEAPGELGRLLARLRVTLPQAPQPSGRAPAGTPARPTAGRGANRRARERAPAGALDSSPAESGAAGGAGASDPPHRRTPWTDDGPRQRGGGVRREPAIASRLGRQGAAAGAALPSAALGSPGRSRPPRGEPGGVRRAGSRLWWALVLLLLLAIAAYAFLAYEDYVPSPF